MLRLALASSKETSLRPLNSYHTYNFYFFLLLLSILQTSCDEKKSQEDQSFVSACQNLIDDDGDELVDLDDPGCIDKSDDDEFNEIILKACADQIDNDNDGKVDINDPACENRDDDDESDDPPPAKCNNRIDDDEDGKIDYPNDPGCSDRLDSDETDSLIPSCSNTLDDDGDLLIDFPADPGCASAQDNDETNEEIQTTLPECSNSYDDDQDGKVDLEDEQCETPADPRELVFNGEPTAACSDFLDNDQDGLIDFPNELGCIAAGDRSEEDLLPLPLCANEIDDDQDGYIDYPNDPGCQGRGDRDEKDLEVVTACFDGFDNDQDGLIDFPNDIGCQSASDRTEIGFCGRNRTITELAKDQAYRGNSRQAGFNDEGSCGGRGGPEVVFLYRVSRKLEALVVRTDFPETQWETTIYARLSCNAQETEIACSRETIDATKGQQLRIENPPLGDLYLILDSASNLGGDYQVQVEEILPAQCLNQQDDDADGLIDFPNDSGCFSLNDRIEDNPNPATTCADQIDNDLDGLTDFPMDKGCNFAADQTEEDLCTQGVSVYDYPFDAPFVEGNQATNQNRNNTGSCSFSNGPEDIYVYDLPIHASLSIQLKSISNQNQRATVYLRSDCLDPRSEEACGNDLINPTTDLNLQIEDLPAGRYFIVVDSDVQGFQYQLSVSATQLPPACSDQIDNDDDGDIDLNDIGCAQAEDEFEIDPNELPACADALDNDQDGTIDFPFEIGCANVGDLSEEDPAVLPACSNGIDDDGDELIDFGADLGCASRGGDDETDPRLKPQCNNRFDDDRDGLVDYPNDPGCLLPADRVEKDPSLLPECGDEEDNDRNGVIDFPFDSGCQAAGDLTEARLNVAPICSNRIDDDDDGDIDFPFDSGCIAAGDEDESDPNLIPQCANEQDDDFDNYTDFPDDIGCRFAADQSEMNDASSVARCRDGVDNDRDFLIDLADSGCLNANDPDEIDPPDVPACADAIDNDEDQLIDWPMDLGCSARGDLCEQEGYGKCAGICIPLNDNPNHCGACGRACPEGTACMEGRCSSGSGNLSITRTQVLECGLSSRPIESMFNEALQGFQLDVVEGCTPTDDTQAILLNRNGIFDLLFNVDIDAYRRYLENGGIIITEYSISHQLYNMIFNTQFNASNGQFGGCTNSLQPVIQLNDDDPFWISVPTAPIPLAQSGCGLDISNLPNVTFLGAWDPQHYYLGYVDVGEGRLWLVESDWQDFDGFADVFSENSKEIMSAMIMGVGTNAAVSTTTCADGRDNDGDTEIDAFDVGCQSLTDDTEEDDNQIPACADGIDNDQNGSIDFPLDAGCETRGDLSEILVSTPECADGQDNDFDGEIDWPNDNGCEGRGGLSERPTARLFACSNQRDDDADGLIDYPNDLGCQTATDSDETNDIPTSVCQNRLDDDRDGLIDFPFDAGCQSARDQSEIDPIQPTACHDGIDNNQDGDIDFPNDSGCYSRGDDSELTPAVLRACSDGIDNDEDSLIDYPNDPECFTAISRSESNNGEPLPACVDGIDNDQNGFIDAQDAGCENAQDTSETDVGETECANGLDDDLDGWTDWPNDLGCEMAGARSENQACTDGRMVETLMSNALVIASTNSNGIDRDRATCGGQNGPDMTYRYVLQQKSNLTIALNDQNTNYPAILSVRHQCQNRSSEIACVGSPRNPGRQIQIPQALPGEYFITVDGGGDEQWQSRGIDLRLPADQMGYEAVNDFSELCWNDGGFDAFDCFGSTELRYQGASQFLDIQPSNQASRVLLNGYEISYRSQLIGNVWRLIIEPRDMTDIRPIDLSISGNIGSDGDTRSQISQTRIEGRDVPYLRTTDNLNAPVDPPIIYMMITSNPEQLGQVSYDVQADDVMITANQITLPVVLYVVPSFLRANQILPVLIGDIDPFAGADANAAIFGQFELQITEEAIP